MKPATRKQIAGNVFAPARATRKLTDEPLAVDDWRRIYEAQQAFIAVVRQVVFEARCRREEGEKLEPLAIRDACPN